MAKPTFIALGMLCLISVCHAHGTVTRPAVRANQGTQSAYCPWCVGENRQEDNPSGTINRDLVPSTPCLGGLSSQVSTQQNYNGFADDVGDGIFNSDGTAIKQTYAAGETFSARMYLNADHAGDAIWELCPTGSGGDDTDDACFSGNPITGWRDVHTSFPDCNGEEGCAAGRTFDEDVTIPSSTAAGAAVLRWKWVCLNTNEVFVGCIDINVGQSDGSNSTPAPATPAPTPVPTSSGSDGDSGGFCSWNNCQSSGGEWCNLSAENCASCSGGQWCPTAGSTPPPTPAVTLVPPTPAATPSPSPSPSGGFCSWDGCQSAGGAWCNLSEANCQRCGNSGSWCPGTGTGTDTGTGTGSPGPNTPAPTPTPAPGAGTGTGNSTGIGATGTLKATHFWDCSGAACDATVLTTPWTNGQNDQYLYAAQYAPLDPNSYGGAVYGERLWATGAASDFLTAMLGADDSCCGSVSEAPGGCGKCLLVRSPSAVNSDWSAVVMKKNRCPPWSNGCEAGNAHLDIAVPGYDNLGFSTANICGQNANQNTILTRAESSVCGGDPANGVPSWYDRGGSTLQGCDCAALPSATAEQRLLKRGCELFTQWGWTSGDPELTYEVVDCPARFTEVVGAAFDGNGPTGVIDRARKLRGAK